MVCIAIPSMWSIEKFELPADAEYRLQLNILQTHSPVRGAVERVSGDVPRQKLVVLQFG